MSAWATGWVVPLAGTLFAGVVSALLVAAGAALLESPPPLQADNAMGNNNASAVLERFLIERLAHRGISFECR